VWYDILRMPLDDECHQMRICVRERLLHLLSERLLAPKHSSELKRKAIRLRFEEARFKGGGPKQY
jgi:hypothetical protein